jgi:hypothetical protein
VRLRVIPPERTGSPTPLRGGEYGGLSFARKAYSPDGQGRQERRAIVIDDVASLEAASAQIDAFIAKRARGAKSGRERANDEEAYWKARDRRQTRARRLENLKEWASHFGGLVFHHHDQAARCAERRDEALALVKELEAGSGRMR